MIMSDVSVLEVTQQMRWIPGFDPVIIMLSANIRRQEFWHKRAPDQGAYGVITKSIDSKSFAGEVERMVATRGR